MWFTPIATPSYNQHTTPVAWFQGVAGGAVTIGEAFNARPQQRGPHTRTQAPQVRRTADGKVADGTGKGCEGRQWATLVPTAVFQLIPQHTDSGSASSCRRLHR